MAGKPTPQHESLRKTLFAESKFDPHKAKFGLFSVPGFVATTEDTYARPLPDHRDELGKVKLRPKNFMVSAASTNSKGGCFSASPYECDLYSDPPRVYQIEKERAERMYKTNGSAWKYSGDHKEKITPYEYIIDPIKGVSCHKEPDGSVKTRPKNFYTAPAKRGASTPGITIGKLPEYIPDPYEAYENWLKMEKIKQQKKRLYGDFKTTAFGSKNFEDNRSVFRPGSEGKGFKKYEYEGVNHKSPFMATCPIGFTIQKYPKHMENIVREVEEARKIEKPWKHTGVLGTVPTRAVVDLR